MSLANHRIPREAALYGWDCTPRAEQQHEFTSPSGSATVTVYYNARGRVHRAFQAQDTAGWHRDCQELRGPGTTWRVVRFIHRHGRRTR